MVDSWQSAVCGAFAGAEDYIILRKTKGGGGVVKILSMQKQHSSEIPDCLDEESSTSCLRKECHRKRKNLERYLLERQPVCFQQIFLFICIKAFTQTLWVILKMIYKALCRQGLAVGAGLTLQLSALSTALGV